MTIPKEIIEKVLSVRKSVTVLKKEDFNPHGEYNYVGIDAYYERVARVATEAGLGWRTREVSFDFLEGQGSRKDRTFVKAKFAYDLMTGGVTSEDYMAVTILSPIDGAQTTGQLYSYADKVFMRVAFCVATGEKDADANKQEPISIKSVPDPILSPATIVSGEQVSNPLVQGNGTLPPHDEKTGEVFSELPPVQAALAPKFKDGLPLIDTKKVESEQAVQTITEIFRVFLPKVTAKTKLMDWYAENIPAMEKAEKLKPGAKADILALFTARREAIEGKKKAPPKDEFEL